MKAKHNDGYEIIGICEQCQNEVWGRKLADGELVLSISPCERCLEEEFEKGYREGYEDCSDLHYRKRLDLWLRRT